MRVFLVLSLVVVLSACSAEYKSIQVEFDPTDGESILIDAKQRAIISVTRDVLTADGQQVRGIDGKPVTDLAVCAEPSPDALQATAVALAGSRSSESLKNLLNLSASSSESAASIGLRTQSIQLLRDAYFRLCEAFLNDGIDSIAYDVLHRRFQNQIIALLAVEQLTGTVKADQAALNTSAAGDAGAKAGLIAQTLEIAEEDLLRLQKAQDANATELSQLNEKKNLLKAEHDTAFKNLNKDENSKVNSDLQQKEKQAKNNLESNNNGIKDAERRKTRLEGQIERRNQHIVTLIEAFGEAAKATITSNASGFSMLGGRDTTSNPSHTSDVVDAVRAITLSAINQDYEVQVCFESLRYRNNVDQFKNNLNSKFLKFYSVNEKPLSENIFLKHCKELFDQHARLRRARANLIEAHARAISRIVDNVGDGSGNSVNDAAKLILVLSQAAPTEPGVSFLKRKFDIQFGSEQSNGIPECKDSKKPGESIRFETQQANGSKVEDCAERPGLDEVNNILMQQVEALMTKVDILEKEKGPGQTVTLGNTTKNIVTPLKIKTSTVLGDSTLILQCDAGEKPSSDGSKCIARCDHEGVIFDSESNECIVPEETVDSEEASN